MMHRWQNSRQSSSEEHSPSHVALLSLPDPDCLVFLASTLIPVQNDICSAFGLCAMKNRTFGGSAAPEAGFL